MVGPRLFSAPASFAALLVAALGSATLSLSSPLGRPSSPSYLLDGEPTLPISLECITHTAHFYIEADPAIKLHKLDARSACTDADVDVKATVKKLGHVTADDQTVLLATRDDVEVVTQQERESTWRDRMSMAMHRSSSSSSSAHEVTGALVNQQAQLDLTSLHLSSPSSSEMVGVNVIHLSSRFALLQVSATTLARIDALLPRDTRVRRLTFHPSRYDANEPDQETPKPQPHYAKPRYNGLIDSIVSSSTFDVSHLRSDVRILTGEDAQPLGLSWSSRHSSTYGAHQAASWLRDTMAERLRSVRGSRCTLDRYNDYFSPNVVCTIPGRGGDEGQGDQGVVLISAHYDSRGTFGETSAPGGDDDGSGTTALLAIARALGRHPSLSFTSPVQLVAFSGEEQGLIGSQHHANVLSAREVKVKLALQMDMLAYRAAHEPMQLGFPDRLSTTTATQHVRRIAQIYTPELVTGYTPACCSDHLSFWQVGFPATWVFERNGPIADPMYHTSGDKSEREGYDFEQLKAAARTVAATLLDVAGFYM